jgi:hypothetical protein
VGIDKKKGMIRASEGVTELQHESWDDFVAYVNEHLTDFQTYIWRGHACDDWLLEPSLDRELKDVKESEQETSLHLAEFVYASRGRVHTNLYKSNTENDLWGAGRHEGLLTPLLDWTRSPFIVAYFAFYDDDHIDQTDNRVIWGFHEPLAKKKSGLSTVAAKIEFIELLEDNRRLTSQASLFTKAPTGVDIESWVRKVFKGEDTGGTLLKMMVPNAEREYALKTLNRWNINHLTLFPDLFGAAMYCNLCLRIKNYSSSPIRHWKEVAEE